ncbi:MAG: GDP-mannose 4,6-dehydratase [Candidatus Glassbacteria bacterium]|nr:GDP-mannose 4,6-dehydratase [Candidatus Glassbacteria bacterium]
MQMLVTGGAGFIGSHLVERLLAEGHEVTCLDNFNHYYDPAVKRRNISPLLEDKRFTLVEADIRDMDTLRSLFRERRFDKVIHLAAQPGVRLSLQNPGLYMNINVTGTLNLLEALREFGTESFIFGSSSSVYGATEAIPFREDGELKPISPYGASKRAGELLCEVYRHVYRIPIVVLRFFTVYGPRQRPDMAIHKFIRQIDRGGKISLYGDGLSRRDYTFVADIVDGIVAALDKGFAFETFNLGNSEPVALRHLISTIEDCLGKKAVIENLPEQPGDPFVTYADIEKSGRLLDYRPQVKIEQGLERFVRWYEEAKKQG